MAGDDQTAMLREAAKARGFKLVKSRRRKAGGDFGKYALTDEKGRECFGFGENGLTADSEAVLAYLRGGETASWKRSLMGVVKAAPAAKRSEKEPPRTPPRKRGGESEPSRSSQPVAGGAGSTSPSSDPKPEKLTIRPATVKDVNSIAQLLGTDSATLKKRLAVLSKAKAIPLVAKRDGIVGLITWAIVPSLDQPARARITTLIVAEDSRREGIGTALLAAAEKSLKKAKVAELELLLDLSLSAPAGFLRKTGWTRSANAWHREAG